VLGVGLLLALLSQPAIASTGARLVGPRGASCAPAPAPSPAEGLAQGAAGAHCLDGPVAPSAQVRPGLVDPAPSLRGASPHLGTAGTRCPFPLDLGPAARHVRLHFGLALEASASRVRALTPQPAGHLADRPTIHTRPLRGPPARA
jgi:hypothetical protein